MRMDIEEIVEYCMSKPGAEESFPFDEHTIVFKVGGKIFALTGLNDIPPSINLKCDPDKAIMLRESHDEIVPGYHMNKKHWNTVYFDSDLDNKLVKELIDHSYHLVKSSLPKAIQSLLNE